MSTAAVYGVLIVAYSKFYSELGVRANEVGLEYGPGLGGIAGMGILLLFFVLGSALLTLGYMRAFRRLTSLSVADLLHTYRLQVVTFNIMVLFLFWLWVAIAIANVKADSVKDGQPVEPVEFLGLEIFSYRAELAHVAAIDPKLEASKAYEEVDNAPTLLYLGRSGSTLVVYEKGRQSAWHLPASSFAVRALNCETSREDRDPACP